MAFHMNTTKMTVKCMTCGDETPSRDHDEICEACEGHGCEYCDDGYVEIKELPLCEHCADDFYGTEWIGDDEWGIL